MHPRAGAEPELAPALRWQRAVDDALSTGELPAAAVVLEIGSRQPLALGRHRGADPATIALRPGSTVKPLLAWIAAEAGALPLDQAFTCEGRYAPLPDFHCPGTHGPLHVPDAIETSCNTYFFDVARRLGKERVSAGFASFGFGASTGLVPGETNGLVASSAWVAHARAPVGEHWHLAVGIGHGPLEVTPLQLAVAYARLAELLTRPSSAVSDAARADILRGLHRAIDGERGTGLLAAVPGIDLVGKTGTAEGGAFGDAASEGAPENGWFVAFEPAAAPSIVVAVVVIGGKNGGKSAAPITGSILQRFRDSRPGG